MPLKLTVLPLAVAPPVTLAGWSWRFDGSLSIMLIGASSKVLLDVVIVQVVSSLRLNVAGAQVLSSVIAKLLAHDCDREVQLALAIQDQRGVAHFADWHVARVHGDAKGRLAKAGHLDLLWHGHHEILGRLDRELPGLVAVNDAADSALDGDHAWHHRHIQAGVVGIPEVIL